MMPADVVADMYVVAEQVRRDFTAALGKESSRFITFKGGLRPLSETVGKDLARFMQFYSHERLTAAFNIVCQFIIDFQAAAAEARASLAMWQRFMSEVIAESDFLSTYQQTQRESQEVARYLELCRLGVVETLLEEREDFRLYAAYVEALTDVYAVSGGA